MSNKKTISVCPKCKDQNIEIRYWVNVNTLKITTEDENSDYWCEGCQEHFDTAIEMVSMDDIAG